MMQAPCFDGLSLDPFPLFQDGLTTTEVNISWGQVVDALVIAMIVVMIHRGFDAGLKVFWEEVVFQQNAVLQGLMPAFDLALGLGVIRCPLTWLI